MPRFSFSILLLFAVGGGFDSKHLIGGWFSLVVFLVLHNCSVNVQMPSTGLASHCPGAFLLLESPDYYGNRVGCRSGQHLSVIPGLSSQLSQPLGVTPGLHYLDSGFP
jgi:hypothetical protein